MADRTWLEPPRGPAPHPHRGVGVAGVTAGVYVKYGSREKPHAAAGGSGVGAWCARLNEI